MDVAAIVSNNLWALQRNLGSCLPDSQRYLFVSVQFLYNFFARMINLSLKRCSRLFIQLQLQRVLLLLETISEKLYASFGCITRRNYTKFL